MNEGDAAVVPPRLEKKDLHMRVFRKTIRYKAPGATPSNDYVVVRCRGEGGKWGRGARRNPIG